MLLYLALLFVCVAGGLALLIPPHIYPIAAVMALIAVAFMIYSPITALLIYLVFFLAWPQEWAPYFQYLPAFTERIIGFMAIGSLAITMLFRQQSYFYLGRIGYAAIGLMVAYALSAFNAYYLTEVKDTLIDVLRLFVVYILIVNIVDNPRKLRAVVWLYFAAVGVHIVMSVLNYYSGIVQVRMGIARALGLGLSYADPNSHAATIVYTLPVVFYFMREYAGKIQTLILVGIGALGCWNIILTGSRTAMVGVLFLAGVIIFRSKRKLVYALAAVLLLAMVAVVMPDQYKERFVSTTDLSSDTGAAESARGRLEGLEHGFKLWMQSPITGVGAGCYAIARGVEFGIYMSSHNMLGELIAESGVVGLAAFGFFVWAVFTTLRKARRWLAANRDSPDNRMMFGLAEGILVGYALLFLLGLAGHNLYRYNWFFFGALVTVIWRLVALQIDRGTAPPETTRDQVETATPVQASGHGGSNG